MGLSVKNGWLDEQGRVYIIFPVQEVMDALGCADNKATKLFRELEKFGLIERKRRGLGKPNLIYVKNFADPRFRNREKNGSGAADSAQLEVAKSRGNKTEWNKTEGSEPDPFSSDAEDEPDERTRLEAYFMQSLEVDLLLRACPDEEDTIHQIVNLLVDTCSSKRRMLRVAGDDKPTEVVRSRFMKLNADHTRGNSPSYGTSFQKLGHELMSRDELAVLDGGKCILQLRGVRPFLSEKYDLTQHPNYKLTADYDPKNTFDIEKYLHPKIKIHPSDAFVVVDADSLPPV